jgi:hypothetical protein
VATPAAVGTLGLVVSSAVIHPPNRGIAALDLT